MPQPEISHKMLHLQLQLSELFFFFLCVSDGSVVYGKICRNSVSSVFSLNKTHCSLSIQNITEPDCLTEEKLVLTCSGEYISVQNY